MTLLDASVPAWLTVWIDGRRLLPLRLGMTVPARNGGPRLRADRYGPFDGPVTIVPPVGG